MDNNRIAKITIFITSKSNTFMKYLSHLFIAILFSAMILSCDLLGNGNGLTEEEIIEGLKEALKVGAGNSVDSTARYDGYFGNPVIKIPFPQEAQVVADVLETAGFGSLVDDAVESINRAAEDAADDALPIFIDAITSMTIQDGSDILYGADSAATHYLRDKTWSQLFNTFEPTIQTSLDNVGATQYWDDLMSTYNSIPFVTPVNTDLGEYTTDKALKGLFVITKDEEKNIRENPEARVNDILQKVFGELD